MARKAATTEDTTVLPGEKILTVKLSDILIDRDWNARSGAWENDETDADDTTSSAFKGLRDSIKARGQDTPVVLRPTTKGKQPYQLVAGFQRTEAIRLNAEEAGEKHPTVKAIVRELNDLEARALNIRENTARNNLKGPDLAWAIGQMLTQGSTDSAIAAEIGKHQTYVSKLKRIVTETAPAVFDKWRKERRAKVTVDKMEKIAKIKPAEKQDEAYENAIGDKKDVQAAGDKLGKWLENMKQKADKLGFLLGRLEYHELITVPVEFDGEFVRATFPLPKSGVVKDKEAGIDHKITAKHINSIARSLKDGWSRGKSAEAEEEESEDSEDEDSDD